jgi:C4-type Zn-finger protein
MLDNTFIIIFLIVLCILLIGTIMLAIDRHTIKCPICDETIIGTILEDGDIGDDDNIKYYCDCGYNETKVYKYKDTE